MSSTDDFTTAQANDLARHFLGPEWRAAAAGRRCHLIRTDFTLDQTHVSDNWRSAFRALGVKLPYRPRFTAVGRNVVQGDDVFAVCKSNNFACRTADALNNFHTRQ